MKRHPFDVVAMVWGVLFLAVAVGVVLDEVVGLTVQLRWLIPVGLIVVGLAGVLTAVTSRASQSRASTL